MIKPEFFTDDDLCSIDIEASHLFSGLWCFADDYGAIYYSERSIMGEIYCKRDSIKWKKVQKWIQDLINIGSLIQCSYCGRDYLVVTNWEDHQTINRPSSRTYLEKSITYKVRLMYNDMRHSGQTTGVAPELFLSVSLTNMKEKENKKGKEKEKGNAEEFREPSLEDVENYFVDNGFDKSLALRFYKGYKEANWYDSKGNQVRNWKQKAQQVWFKNNDQKPLSKNYRDQQKQNEIPQECDDLPVRRV